MGILMATEGSNYKALALQKCSVPHEAYWECQTYQWDTILGRSFQNAEYCQYKNFGTCCLLLLEDDNKEGNDSSSHLQIIFTGGTLGCQELSGKTQLRTDQCNPIANKRDIRYPSFSCVSLQTCLVLFSEVTHIGHQHGFESRPIFPIAKSTKIIMVAFVYGVKQNMGQGGGQKIYTHIIKVSS